MLEEYGSTAFDNGCPVCHLLCCCSNKTVYCTRINHCYRKCPSTKTSRPRKRKVEPVHPRYDAPEPLPYSVAALSFLAAVADANTNADTNIRESMPLDFVSTSTTVGESASSSSGPTTYDFENTKS